MGPAAAGEPAGGDRHPGPGSGRGEVRRGDVASAPNYLLQVHSRAHLGHGAVPHLLHRPDLPHGEAALPRARCPVCPPCTSVTMIMFTASIHDIPSGERLPPLGMASNMTFIL